VAKHLHETSVNTNRDGLGPIRPHDVPLLFLDSDPPTPVEPRLEIVEMRSLAAPPEKGTTPGPVAIRGATPSSGRSGKCTEGSVWAKRTRTREAALVSGDHTFFLPMRRNIYNGAMEDIMHAAPDTLTPAEAAVVAGVSMRDVHRVIDEHILPEGFYDTREARSFTSHACVFIAFFFEAADRLTSGERQRAIALASRDSSGEKSFTKIIHDGFLTIDFAPFWTSVDERLQRLNAARAQVSIDGEILSGTPTIRGTRVPVYDVAASVAAGNPIERILSSYPGLNREQVELAALFAEANPQRGRPRQRVVPPSGIKVISSRRKPRSVSR
jgi:uncharacterized protein (DUF433 family)